MTDTIQKLTYDDFGHIIGNNRSGTAADMSYAYDNLHGWTTQIMSAGGFVQNLYRETDAATPRWDGSISATTWQTEDDMEHRYDYTYDGLNRLTKADYTSRFSLQQRVVTDLPIIDTVIGTIDGIKNAVSPRFSLNKLQALIPESENSNLTIEQTEESAETSVHTGFDSGTIEEPPLTKVSPDNYTKQNGDYSELVEYDANTNITSLLRYGMKNNKQYGLIDDLSIHHNGNQITSVSDAVDENLNYEGAFDFVDGENKDKEYAYDGNGALTMDLNKRIQSIEYDLLGNPRKITMTYGKSIEYIYASDGRKLRTIHYQKIKNPNYSSLTMREPKYIEIKDSTDYIGNLRLSDGKANMYLFQGGYYSFDGENTPECHYYIADYQGNNRMVVNAHNNEVEQTTHYYPYGGIIGNLSSNQEAQKYKYSGKELDRTYGLDLYDFEARQYNAALPVFDRPDPLAWDYTSLSPYNYCAGDPVNCVDPDGRDVCPLKAPHQVAFAGGRAGHSAMLIQDSNGIWKLYSKNGTKSGFSGLDSKDKGDQYGVGGWKSVEEFFMDPMFNTGEDGLPEYTNGYIISTSSEQDAQAAQTMSEELDDGYNLLWSNCVNAVQNALESIKIDSGSGFLPNDVYESIKENNKGTEVILFKPVVITPEENKQQ